MKKLQKYLNWVAFGYLGGILGIANITFIMWQWWAIMVPMIILLVWWGHYMKYHDKDY